MCIGCGVAFLFFLHYLHLFAFICIAFFAISICIPPPPLSKDKPSPLRPPPPPPRDPFSLDQRARTVRRPMKHQRKCKRALQTGSSQHPLYRNMQSPEVLADNTRPREGEA